MADSLTNQANQGVQRRGATLQTPKGYSGGGMPRNGGLSGVDPAIADPSMLKRPGLGLPNWNFTGKGPPPTVTMPSNGELSTMVGTQHPGTGAPGEQQQIINSLQMALDQGFINTDQLANLNIPDDPNLIDYGGYDVQD